MALNKMAEVLQGTTPSGLIPQLQESQTEFDANKIREFDSIKEDIASIKGTMAEILSHLKKK